MPADCGFTDLPGQPGRDTLVQYGPLLPVEIGLDPSYRSGASVRPSLPSDERPALVDTGAEQCCIDSDLAIMLNLPIVDRQAVAGAHGRADVNMHLAQIYVPALGWTVYGQFAGVHLIAGGQPYYALIGRTFLRHFTMVYEGKTGVVTLS